jgi:hypothetical protein
MVTASEAQSKVSEQELMVSAKDTPEPAKKAGRKQRNQIMSDY